MIKFITGQPGNGKSLRALFDMAEEYERNAAAVKVGKEQPRRFFTNIAGATTDENPDAFPWVERIPEHNDWTQLPDGSYVVYDEAHADGATPELARYGRLFPSTGKPGESDDPRIRAMSTHRHRGFDIVLVTQWPTKIHHQVRTLVGEHTHMTRAMGLGLAGVVKWTRVQMDPYDEKSREKAEEEMWRFDKSLYTRYKSATLHTVTHRFRVPKKVWSGLSVLGMVLLMAWFSYAYVKGKYGKEEQPQEQERAQGQAALAAPAPSVSSVDSSLFPGVGLHSAINTEPVPSLAGCVASDRGCRCFNTDGFQIDMTRQECERTIAEPLPFNVYHEYSQGREVQRSQPASSPSQASSNETGGGDVVVGYKPGSRGDVFPRSPGYTTETLTGPVTGL